MEISRTKAQDYAEQVLNHAGGEKPVTLIAMGVELPEVGGSIDLRVSSGVLDQLMSTAEMQRGAFNTLEID